MRHFHVLRFHQDLWKKKIAFSNDSGGIHWPILEAAGSSCSYAMKFMKCAPSKAFLLINLLKRWVQDSLPAEAQSGKSFPFTSAHPVMERRHHSALEVEHKKQDWTAISLYYFKLLFSR